MMKVEIWSDVLCPFCYIGKREFELAMDQFDHAKDVEVVWKSFELDRNASKESELDIYDRLSAKYGGTREESRTRVAGVVERAVPVGLKFEMDRAKPTNSFDAHRVLQYAKTVGIGDPMKERLFKAYFMEGALISDVPTLIELAVEVGLDGAAVAEILSTEKFTEEVRFDEHDAQQLGIRGVPFFVLDRKYGVSGAQSHEHFLEVLNRAWGEVA